MLDELDDQDTAASHKLYFTHYCTSFDQCDCSVYYFIRWIVNS